MESEEEMPKEKKIVGRKECMDAMCHRCQHFNAAGAADCERQSCPLYAFNPLAKLTPEIGWAKLKVGRTVGFAPKKGVDETNFALSVESVVNYNYGWDLVAMPPLLQEQRDRILVVAPVPEDSDEVTKSNDNDVDW